MSKKKELENKINILERQSFLDVYSEFNNWLTKYVGFKDKSMAMREGDCMTMNNIIVNEINTLWGVEHYTIEALNLSIYFARERNRHIFYVVEGFFARSAPLTIEEFKADIVKQVTARREKKMEDLSELLTVTV